VDTFPSGIAPITPQISWTAGLSSGRLERFADLRALCGKNSSAMVLERVKTGVG
jgi:hypothetical protein